MVTYLRGQHLFGYVDESILSPSFFLSDTATVNSAYTHWVQQDQLILSTIILSLSENLIAQIISLTTSQAAWSALENLFASKTQARLGQLHFQLATLKKGSDSITDFFFRKTKLLADTMAAAGCQLSSTEFNTYLLVGLSIEYDSLVISVTTRFDLPSSEELFIHLPTHEAWLNHQNASLPSSEITANVSTKSTCAPYHGGRSRRNRGSFRDNHGRGGSNRCGSFQSFPDDHLHCQVCFKSRHTTMQCYHRFNQAY